MENLNDENVLYPTQEERNLAMLCHLLGFFVSFIAPLIIYLIKKDTSPFVRENAKEALNFQISMAIYYFISILLVLLIIGIFGLLFLGFFSLVVSIVATIKATEGKVYRYPMSIRFI